MKAVIFHIQGSDSIQSVQHRFETLFPSMQISFFRDPDTSRQSDQCIMFPGNMSIGEIKPEIKDLMIEISPSIRVIDFEKMIRMQGLHVQISCRIKDRRAPDSSVSRWFLNDVYGLDNPLPYNTSIRQPILTSAIGSITK